MNNEASMRPVKAEESVYFHNDESGSKILVRILERDIGKTILEVGAGVGGVTQELALVAHSVVSLEPNRTLFDELRRKTSQLSNVTCVNVTLEEFVRTRSSSALSQQQFDSVVYINVLEHIEHDVRELTLASEVLSSVGRVLIVVPAHSWLYSKVDRLSGHFRRYSRSGLTTRLRQAGLRPMRLEYFDSIGLLPYLIVYKWLRSTAVSGTNAVVYSKLILPVSKVLHRLSRGRLIGKNLVVVAQKGRAVSSTKSG